ncbi:Bud-site selection protein, BUD22 [Ophiocordyceps camponoti-floridani]|uniref:Bud-site selection protein, BUD22 n=1 Tax=Ophiocordyceps camponoti-floridani TaxID=2030778 RepID=A0A8H4QDF2_9HYPO|nr:Bud-site selection protein, BUD22 [Ophiocordyceps camponoti-floridani]
MPKRKRDAESSAQVALEKHQADIFRALKAAKGFERQRLSKRLREDGVLPDKQRRLEREVATLKSLDLHQTARVHLTSSLLKIKSIAGSPDLPEALRVGVPKSQLPEEERLALHNVTSALYNRDAVKKATDRAVLAMCRLLDVSASGKAKRSRKSEPAEARDSSLHPEPSLDRASSNEDASDDNSELDGFESDVDEPGPAVGPVTSDAEAAEEAELAKYDDCLGSSSDEDDQVQDARFQRLRGRDTSISNNISLSESSSDGEMDLDAESAPSRSPLPRPAKTSKDKSSSTVKLRTTGNSTFLPSLMGGYISGSESASDVEVAKPKPRRGQRARQAIWEKKYGANAKHLQKQKEGRDAGWDMRRGAVADDERNRNGPWKRGASRNSSAKKGGSSGATTRTETRIDRPHKPAKADNDDARPLHPSWAAKKKARDAQRTVAFSGQKMVFD